MVRHAPTICGVNMGFTANNIPNINELLRRMLDRGYDAQMQTVLDAMFAESTTGMMQTRLAQLELEAARLTQNGEKMTADNPVLRAVFADLDVVMQHNRDRLNRITENLQAQGIQAANTLTLQMTAAGTDMAGREILRAAWNQPDPETLKAAVDYSTKPAWMELLDKYKTGVEQVARQTAIRGIVNGRGPLAIARDLKRVIEELPISKAQTLARTLQLSSYRQAAAMNQLANSEILVEQIRIAVLDARTCMSCVFLHGHRMPVGEVVADHWNGRCTSICVVKGGRVIDIPPGEEWFKKQGETTQVAMMGGSAYDLWKEDRIQLRDFVRPYQDDLFGNMVREASLKEILAEMAH